MCNEGTQCACCSDPHEEFRGQNILIEREPLEATASALGLTLEEAEASLAKARALLHARRAQRPRPHLDDKVCRAADRSLNPVLIPLIKACMLLRTHARGNSSSFVY